MIGGTCKIALQNITSEWTPQSVVSCTIHSKRSHWSLPTQRRGLTCRSDPPDLPPFLLISTELPFSPSEKMLCNNPCSEIKPGSAKSYGHIRHRSCSCTPQPLAGTRGVRYRVYQWILLKKMMNRVFNQLADLGWVDLDLRYFSISSNCSAISLKIPSAWAKLGKQRNCQDQSQFNQGPRADETPCMHFLWSIINHRATLHLTSRLWHPLTRWRLVSELELEAVDRLSLIVLDRQRVRLARHLLGYFVDGQRGLELALYLLKKVKSVLIMTFVSSFEVS